MNDLGEKIGSSSGYVDLGTDVSPLPGVQLEGGSKVVCGALAVASSDVISASDVEPGHYYLKIALDVKNAFNVNKPSTYTSLKKLAVTPLVDIDATAKELPYNFYGGYVTDLLSYFSAPAISTVNSLSIVKANNKRQLQAAKGVEWHGHLSVDGQIAMGYKYSLVNVKLPQARNWTMTVENVALGSSFGNLRGGDMVTSAPGVVMLRNGGSFVRYMANNNTGHTDTQEFRYKYNNITHRSNGLDIAAVGTDAQGNLGMYGLDFPGKELTVISNYHDTSNGHTFGLTVDTYKVVKDKYNNRNLLRITTASDGLRTVRYSTENQANPDLNLSKMEFGDVITSESYVDSTFDWTAKQNGTGYFAVSKGAATAKAGHTTIKSKDADKDFMAVKLYKNGGIESIKQMRFAAATGTMTETSSKFSGRLTLNLGGQYLTFDRSTALSGTSIDTANTTLAISGVNSGSYINNLSNGDTVSTIAIPKGECLTVNDMSFFAAVKSQLGFKMQGGTITATKGSFSLIPDDDNYFAFHSQLSVYDGTKAVAIGVSKGQVTVNVTTNSKGVSSYTIGNLQVNTQFSVGDVVYRKTLNNLYRIEGNKVTGVYALGNKTSVASTVLTTGIKPVADTFTKNTTTSPYGLPTVALTAVENRWRQDLKKGTAAESYDVVVDSYVVATTKSNAKAKMATYIVSDSSDLQTVVGTAAPSELITENTPSYTAAANVAQHIQAANGWHVTGSDGDDTITGAVKGVDYIRGGKGDDTIVLGKASDVVSFNLSTDGNDVVKGYTAKDEIVLDGGNDFTVDLDTKGANVFLRQGDGSVQLVGMGKAQSVLINGNKYHFGNGTLAKNKTQTTAGTNFAYDSGAHYYGNDSGKNTLTISKAASKEATAERLTIDFSNNDNKGTSSYYNIDTVNANASAKGVDFTAGSRNSKFIGSAYDDTITCGDGRDYISCAPGKGNDTVNNFGVSDVLQLNGLTKESIEAISAYNGNGSLVLTAKSGKLTSTITLNNITASKLTYNAKAKTVTGA